MSNEHVFFLCIRLYSYVLGCYSFVATSKTYTFRFSLLSYSLLPCFFFFAVFSITLASELQADLDQSTVSSTGSDMSPQQMNEVRAAMR
jgi:hypothetical protein